jgi:hypothetical protein
MFNQSFDCNTVAKLKDCDSSNYYYVSDSLSYSGTIISTGDTFSAKINTPDGAKYLCLLYESDDSGSSNSYIETIYGISSDCGSCTPPVPPTPTPSNTPTPSVTPTNTPTPSPSYVSPNALYVYSACTGANRVISQNVGVPSVSVGQSFNYNNECWTFVGLFNSPYSPPAGFIYSTSTTNFFGTPLTVYNDCDSCVSAPLNTFLFDYGISGNTGITGYTSIGTFVGVNNEICRFLTPGNDYRLAGSLTLIDTTTPQIGTVVRSYSNNSVLLVNRILAYQISVGPVSGDDYYYVETDSNGVITTIQQMNNC